MTVVVVVAANSKAVREREREQDVKPLSEHELIDKIVRDIVRTLKDGGISAERITDWVKGGRDDDITTILIRHGFNSSQISAGVLSAGDILGVIREQQ